MWLTVFGPAITEFVWVVSSGYSVRVDQTIPEFIGQSIPSRVYYFSEVTSPFGFSTSEFRLILPKANSPHICRAFQPLPTRPLAVFRFFTDFRTLQIEDFNILRAIVVTYNSWALSKQEKISFGIVFGNPRIFFLDLFLFFGLDSASRTVFHNFWT